MSYGNLEAKDGSMSPGEAWADWKSGVTPGEQRLAETGLLMRGNHTSSTRAVIGNHSGDVHEIDATAVKHRHGTLFIPSTENARKIHGAVVTPPKTPV